MLRQYLPLQAFQDRGRGEDDSRKPFEDDEEGDFEENEDGGVGSVQHSPRSHFTPEEPSVEVCYQPPR